MDHQKGAWLHSLSAAAYCAHKTPWCGKSSMLWCSVDKSSHSRLIWTRPECWWRSLTQLLKPPGPVLSNYVTGTLFCSRWTTCANACCSSFSTQNFCDITAWFSAVRFSPVQPTLGEVMNTEGFCESWNVSCISVCSSLPISACMWNISTWSTK